VVAATLQEAALRKPSEYVGHVEAIQEAEISAQVSGTIKSPHFKEGAVVQEGDLLFTIDPKVYQAKVDQEEATLAQTRSTLAGARASLKSVQAQLAYARQYLKRLKTAGSRSVVQADLDKAKSEALRYEASEQDAEAQIQQLEAQVRQAEANREVARIDLGYTEVRAPITGRIGRD
jgi:multidrug resistance efflux pump